MKRAVLFLAGGFEEIEAVGTIDVLRRAGIDTTVVSITGSISVSGAHRIDISADSLFEQTDFSDIDAFILPGGMPGSSGLNAYEPLKKLLVESFNQGLLLAAICAAPLVLGELGLLKGRKAVCYPGFKHHLEGAIICDSPYVTDGNVITGKGPGLVFSFAMAIVNYLKGEQRAREVSDGLLLKD